MTQESLKKLATKLNRKVSEMSDQEIDDLMFQMGKQSPWFGSESIRANKIGWDKYWTDHVAMYLNTGDTYELTLMFDIPKFKFIVSSVGDWIEKYDRKYSII